MRHLAILLLLVLATACLGGEPVSVTHTSNNQTVVVDMTPTTTRALVLPDRYRYTEEAVADMRVEVGNLSLSLRVVMREWGTVDSVARRAEIRTFTRLLPDNVTTNRTMLIVGDEIVIGNTSVPTDFWKVHPVGLMRELLKLEPIGNYTENGTRVLVYSVPEELVLPLAKLYLADLNLTITDAVATLYPEELRLSLVYTFRAEAGGELAVTQTGTWRGNVTVEPLT